MSIEMQIIVKALNLPLLASAACVAVLAGVVALWIRSSYRGYSALERLGEKGAGFRTALIVLAVAYTFAYSWLSVHRYHKLMLGSWDLGIFESLMANALDGRLFVDYRGPFDHFSPAAYLYLPFWAIWRDARVLLVLQTVVLALAAWPLYLLAKETSKSVLYGALAGILYLLYPLVGAGNLYDFHAVALSPLFFFSMLLFMRRGQWKRYWVFVVLLLAVKEGEAVLVFGTGLCLLFTDRRRIGVLTMAVAVAWTAGVLLAVMPWITGAPFRHFSRYDPGAAQAVPAAARAAQAVALFVYTLLPLSFLPARRWRGFVFLFLPAVAANFFASSSYQWVLFGHYGLTVASAALGAAALSMRPRDDISRPQASAMPVFALIAAVLCNILFSYPAQQRWARHAEYFKAGDSWNVLSMPLPATPARRDFYRLEPHDIVFLAAKDYFPKGSRIAAQNNLGYFFAGAHKLADLDQGAEADFYLFDMKKSYDTPAGGYRALLERLSAETDVKCFFRLASGGGVDFLFFAEGEAWIDFYETALEAARVATDDYTPRIIVSAVEDALGIPPTYPMVMQRIRPPEAAAAQGEID